MFLRLFKLSRCYKDIKMKCVAANICYLLSWTNNVLSLPVSVKCGLDLKQESAALMSVKFVDDVFLSRRVQVICAALNHVFPNSKLKKIEATLGYFKSEKFRITDKYLLSNNDTHIDY